MTDHKAKTLIFVIVGRARMDKTKLLVPMILVFGSVSLMYYLSEWRADPDTITNYWSIKIIGFSVTIVIVLLAMVITKNYGPKK